MLNLEPPRCPDCGAAYYSCQPNLVGGVTYVKEGQMAAGEMVALTRRVSLNEDKTAVVDHDALNASWFLGGPGHQILRDEAVALGLKEGEDFGPIPNAMDAILAQNRRNRETYRLSENTIVEPRPAFQTHALDRRTFDGRDGSIIGTDGQPVRADEDAKGATMPEETSGSAASEAPVSSEASGDAEAKQAPEGENKAMTEAPETRARVGGATRAR